ncbi:DUF4625 domain-containing protein [Ancylomarina salipaludis]|uniref:DUF4625 domain-containing protein n=1 Tax=Ancylomarina salipaludis TaxID=2501299 RepID=A0A4Q1JJA7_9BACT|nr:DUF4625 domain-containing protein [Ancylomarina salipaludis]RXQ90965.1 DUF4625 domain-containing protein [Ancylomarina salipaludis]
MKHLTPLKKSAFLLVLLPIFGFVNIPKQNIDKLSPKIELNSPGERLEVVRGGHMQIKAFLQDDQELDSYRLMITKGGIDSYQFADAFSSYHQKDAHGNALPIISGSKTQLLDFYIKVDANAIVGDYCLTLFLKDKAGNEQKVERFFNVCCY